MSASFVLGGLAVLSFVLLIWQWLAGRRFPLHRRIADSSFTPPVTVLKPLKGTDSTTAASLRSWLAQDYAGDIQFLFGVESEADPACALVRQLLAEFPARDAQLLVCPERLGANPKVSKLIQMVRVAKHDFLVVSDADVRAPADLLANLVVPLREPNVGLTTCFYRFADPTTLPMRWEAVAVNVDFWSQVLQARSLNPLDFALGAVMAVRREALDKIGGFAALADYLADDYQLGNRIARAGWRVELCPVVVECWSGPMSWLAVWKHQLRWARTIRVCRPVPYFFSILGNATLWSLVWLAAEPRLAIGLAAGAIVIARLLVAFDLARLLRAARPPEWVLWAVPAKDILQVVIWFLAFTRKKIEWHGQRHRITRQGKLVGHS